MGKQSQAEACTLNTNISDLRHYPHSLNNTDKRHPGVVMAAAASLNRTLDNHGKCHMSIRDQAPAYLLPAS
jgi:hypothetical protein